MSITYKWRTDGSGSNLEVLVGEHWQQADAWQAGKVADALQAEIDRLKASQIMVYAPGAATKIEELSRCRACGGTGVSEGEHGRTAPCSCQQRKSR